MMGNIDFLHGSSGDLLHGRQPGMDQIVAMWVPFFFFFLADRIDQWDDGPGAEGTLTTYRPLQASFFFFFLFLPPW